MSNLRWNDEDYPEAAGRHLGDASLLLGADRWAGAAYLAGYVVECSLKTLIVVEGSASAPPGNANAAGYADARELGHDLGGLSKEAVRLASLGGSKVARYVPASGTAAGLEGGWKPKIRYAPDGKVTQGVARTWMGEAAALYDLTVGRMRLDGVVVP
jgi:hypothetical protein